MPALFNSNAFITFYEKDSLTILNEIGKYGIGQWSEGEADRFKLIIKDIGEFKFVKSEENNDGGDFEYLVLKSNNKNGLSINILLKKDDYYVSKNVDLLSYSANKWRLKPAKRESKEEIKKRVLSQLDYMIHYFEFSNEKQYRTFQVNHFASPFKFFANGLGLRPYYDALEYSDLFYDLNDAAQANTMLENGLNSISVYPSDPESYTKGYQNALKQIRKFVELY